MNRVAPSTPTAVGLESAGQLSMRILMVQNPIDELRPRGLVYIVITPPRQTPSSMEKCRTFEAGAVQPRLCSRSLFRSDTRLRLCGASWLFAARGQAQVHSTAGLAKRLRHDHDHSLTVTGALMLEQNESKWNIKKLTDAEISAAIRYLDPGWSVGRFREGDPSLVAICISLVFLLSGAAFVCLYYRVM